MSRRYTDDEKRLVLDRLIANHGDIPRTALESGVSDRTLLRWRTETDIKSPQIALMSSPTSPTSPTQTPSSSPRPEGEGQGVRVPTDLPPETIETFQDIHDKLLPIIDILTGRIVEAIDDASLSQRIVALAQLIDRVTKLAALLPRPVEEIIYIDEYEYGVAHHVEKNPPRHLQDSEESSPTDQTGD
ncbi:MAG: hypothetical protein LCI00_13365 [Chloroflexi bacterium]|nr:hypothetical protein [Chloroflexota bacterium]MCC6892349.1 hypothetical protein [Anaerolineae bacterium]